MATCTVISFLGRTSRTPAGELSYREATYRFADGHRETTRVFVVALFHWLKKQNRPPNRLVVAGTATSMWQCLEDLIAVNEGEMDLLIRIQEGSASSGVSERDLKELAGHLTRSLGVEVRLLVIGSCQTEEEQLEVVGRLADSVAWDSHLVVDVTHGYRHLPLLGVAAAQFLERARNCRIDAVYYGMAEVEGSEKPVVDLKGLTRILDVGEALATWRDSGSFRSLASPLVQEIPEFPHLAFLLDTFQMERAHEVIQRVRGRLMVSNSSLVRVARRDIERILQGISDSPTLAVRQLSQAGHQLKGGDLRGAVLSLYEALSSYAEEQFPDPGFEERGDPNRRTFALDSLREGMNKGEREKMKSLRMVRNILAHGRSSALDASSPLSSYERLKTFAEEMKRWLSQRIVGPGPLR